MSADAPGPENPDLLAAIVGQPDEDTPRLVYADWLQENGAEARAEFVRLHVAWDRRPPDAPPDDDLKRRLRDAWEAVEPYDGWTVRHPDGGSFAFERGFRATAAFAFEGDDFAARAPAAFRDTPVRFLYTSPPTGELDIGFREIPRFLAAARGLPPVTGFGTVLRHNDGLSDPWRQFLAVPQASGLRVLDLNYSRGLEACPLVARLTHLTNLLVLDLTACCRMDDRGLEQLAGAPHLRSLVALRLAADDEYLGAITEDGVASLVASPHLTNLRQLTLNNHEDLNDESVRRLLGWDRVGQLEVLELSCRDVADAGVSLLAQSRKLKNLRRLVLDGRRLSQETIASVLDSPSLRGLRELYLSPAPVSLSVELLHRLRARFPGYATMQFDPPPVCAEDRVRSRYRLMSHPQSGGTYRGRDQAYRDRSEPPYFPEYAIL